MANLVNLTIDDTSPTFIYEPWGEGGAAGVAVAYGWSTYYDALGYLNANGALPRGDSPSGTSYHVTASNTSSVSLAFHGSSIYLFGFANCSYDVMLDATTQTETVIPGEAAGGVLAAYEDLAEGDHTISLRPNPPTSDYRVMLDRAVVTIDTGNSTTVNSVTINNQNTSEITYSPASAWGSASDGGVPSPFYQTGAIGASATLNFTGHAVALYGTLNWGHQLYNVSLDGRVQTFNGSSYWKVPQTVLYFSSGLGEGQHSVSLSDAVPQANVSLYQMVVWQDTASNTTVVAPVHKKNHAGAIAGGVIAAVAGLAIIGAGLWYFFVYRKRRPPMPGREGSPGIGTPPHMSGVAVPYNYQSGINGTETPGAEWKSAPSTLRTPGMESIVYSNTTPFATTELTQSRTSLSYNPLPQPPALLPIPPGVVPLPTHSVVAGEKTDPVITPANPSPLSNTTSSPSPATANDSNVTPWVLTPDYTSPAPGLRTPVPAPPPGALPPAAIHYQHQQQPQPQQGINLTADAVEHILTQLAARIDPATQQGQTSSGSDAPPPMYPTGGR